MSVVQVFCILLLQYFLFLWGDFIAPFTPVYNVVLRCMWNCNHNTPSLLMAGTLCYNCHSCLQHACQTDVSRVEDYLECCIYAPCNFCHSRSVRSGVGQCHIYFYRQALNELGACIYICIFTKILLRKFVITVFAMINM